MDEISLRNIITHISRSHIINSAYYKPITAINYVQYLPYIELYYDIEKYIFKIILYIDRVGQMCIALTKLSAFLVN